MRHAGTNSAKFRCRQWDGLALTSTPLRKPGAYRTAGSTLSIEGAVAHPVWTTREGSQKSLLVIQSYGPPPPKPSYHDDNSRVSDPSSSVGPPRLGSRGKPAMPHFHAQRPSARVEDAWSLGSLKTWFAVKEFYMTHGPLLEVDALVLVVKLAVKLKHEVVDTSTGIYCNSSYHQFMLQVADQLQNQVQKCDLSQVVEVLVSYASVNLHPGQEFMSKMMQAVKDKWHHANLQSLIECLAALAQLGQVPETQDLEALLAPFVQETRLPHTLSLKSAGVDPPSPLSSKAPLTLKPENDPSTQSSLTWLSTRLPGQAYRAVFTGPFPSPMDSTVRSLSSSREDHVNLLKLLRILTALKVTPATVSPVIGSWLMDCFDHVSTKTRSLLPGEVVDLLEVITGMGLLIAPVQWKKCMAAVRRTARLLNDQQLCALLLAFMAMPNNTGGQPSQPSGTDNRAEFTSTTAPWPRLHSLPPDLSPAPQPTGSPSSFTAPGALKAKRRRPYKMDEPMLQGPESDAREEEEVSKPSCCAGGSTSGVASDTILQVSETPYTSEHGQSSAVLSSRSRRVLDGLPCINPTSGNIIVPEIGDRQGGLRVHNRILAGNSDKDMYEHKRGGYDHRCTKQALKRLVSRWWTMSSHLQASTFVDCVWAISQLGPKYHYSPRTVWYQHVIDVSTINMGAFSARDLCRLLEVVGAGKVEPCAAWSERWIRFTEQQMCNWGPQEFTSFCKNLHVFANQRLPDRILLAFYEECSLVLVHFLPEEFNVVIEGMAGVKGQRGGQRLRAAQQDWVDRFLLQSYPQLPNFSLPELFATMKSLAAMRIQPPVQWMSEWLRETSEKLDQAEVTQLVEVLQALKRINYQPGAWWIHKAVDVVRRSFQWQSDADLQSLRKVLPELVKDPEFVPLGPGSSGGQEAKVMPGRLERPVFEGMVDRELNVGSYRLESNDV